MKKLLLCSILCVAVMLPVSAFADLTGTSVTANYLFPNSGSVYGSSTVTVGPGAELTCPGGSGGGGFCSGFAQFTTLDIGANTITLSENCCTAYNPAAFNGQQYFIDPSMTIVGFTLTSSGFPGLSASNVNFLGNMIEINLQGLPVDNSSYTLTVNTTPEPGSMA